MPSTDTEHLYEQLTAAAASRLPPAQMGTLIARAFNAAWDTGDISEALGEGGLDLPFEVIERLAQKFA